MSTPRLAKSLSGSTRLLRRGIATSPRCAAGAGNAQRHPNVDEHRKIQSERALNPHMTNTNSTVANDMPSVGARKAPPELLSSVDPKFVPKDSVPENTERMTGGTQKGDPDTGSGAELDVGEVEGIDFKVEPLRRTGEDANTMRARLLYQSRKRGTLESDLLLSTFADSHLSGMSMEELKQYDAFLHENDWDIYYWATQEPSPTSRETAEGAGEGSEGATASAKGTDYSKPEADTDAWRNGQPRSGEWAQTVGTFKPAYRPVPARWKDSRLLEQLREHVILRSAGGVNPEQAKVEGKGLSQGVRGTGGGGKFPLQAHRMGLRYLGMAFMPPVFNTDQAS